LAGSQKFYLAEPTVNYRVHGGNSFHRRESTSADNFAHGLRRQALKAEFSTLLNIPNNIADQVDTEFDSLPYPTRDEYKEYVSIVWGLNLPLWTKLKKRLKLYSHFRRTQRTKD